MSATALPPITLSDLAVISVEGPDAGSFLQGQLTQDAVGMEVQRARAAGYCSPKGRLLGTFVLVRRSAELWWLLTRAELAEPLAKRLRMFVLRAKCGVQVRSDLVVQGEWPGADAPASAQPWTVQTAADGTVLIGWWGGRCLRVLHAEPAADPMKAAGAASLAGAGLLPQPSTLTWAWADIEAGWPWIETANSDQFVPQSINFELLGGVNFRKGCYPGQEVVARSQYRGTLKRRMAAFTLEATAAPAAGTEIVHSEDPGQPAGRVVNAAIGPDQPGKVRLLAEVKSAARLSGSLHLGSVEGPRLQEVEMPYAVPFEALDD